MIPVSAMNQETYNELSKLPQGQILKTYRFSTFFSLMILGHQIKQMALNCVTVRTQSRVFTKDM
jgi:hypothetical protein